MSCGDGLQEDVGRSLCAGRLVAQLLARVCAPGQAGEPVGAEMLLLPAQG